MANCKLYFCVAGSLVIHTITYGQRPPSRNATVAEVVGYQQYQQKQWNKNQLPKNSIQYKTEVRNYFPPENKIDMPGLNLKPVAPPKPLHTFNSSTLSGTERPSYVQKSRFLNYNWQQQNQWKYHFLKAE